MKTPKNYISETAATETVSRWFADKPGVRQLTLGEIYKAADRESIDEATNRNWFNNKLNQLRHHNLVKPSKEFDKASKRHKTVGVQLTMAGKKALGLIEDDDNQTDSPGDSGTLMVRKVSLNDVAQAVKDFQDKNPEFEVVFDVKFKGVMPAK